MTDLMKIPYPDFVRGLFTKPEDNPGRIAHAAVGLVGEAIELRASSDRHNMKEELGDWAFYAVAL